MEQLAADVGPEKALNGKPAPKPDGRYMLAVLHPTERQVVYVCDGGVVVVYDLTDAHATPRRIVSSRQKPLMFGSFSGEGESFAAGDSEGGITLWETPSWKERTTYVKGTQPVRYVSVDENGSKMLAETEEGVVLWDIRGGKEIGVVADRYRFGTAFCFSKVTAHFATGSLSSVHIHDAQTGKIIREISQDPYPMQLCFSEDGRYIASGLRGSLNKWLGVFDVATGATVFDHAEHEKGITGLLFLDKGTCLLSTSADGHIKFWHVPSGTELLALNLGESVYQPSNAVDGSIILWNQRSGPRYFSIR